MQVFDQSVGAGVTATSTVFTEAVGKVGVFVVATLGVAMTLTLQASADGTNWADFDPSIGSNGPGSGTSFAAGTHAFGMTTYGVPWIRLKATNATGGSGTITAHIFTHARER